MTFPRILVMSLLAALACGCANHLPNTAVPAGAAERSFGTVNEATPLAALIKSQDIRSLDPASREPLLRQLLAQLEKSDVNRRYRGVTYNLTTTNAVDRDWVIQSPNRWNHTAFDLPVVALKCENCLPDIGLPSCRSDGDCTNGATCKPLAALSPRPGQPGQRVCVGHSDALIDRLYSLIVQAQNSVDITALQPPADGRFRAGLRNAITTLARSGRQVSLRLLVGQYPLEGGTDAKALIEDIIRDARNVPNSRLSVYVGAMRTCTGGADCASFTWNHSKIVAIDGRAAWVGGHNLWTADYLAEDPVHDLSMQLRGPAAADASRFANVMWQFICAHKGTDAAVQAFSYVGGSAALGNECRTELTFPAPAAAGNVSVLAVGRLGGGITTDFANQSELARDLMIGAARRTVYIAQQDIAFTLGRPGAIYPESTLERLADFLLINQGEAYIVLSSLGSASQGGMTYSNGVSLDDVALKIRAVARGRSALPDADLDALLCKRLHVAPLRFGPDATWPSGRQIANHSKFWMIDDRAFYIGSDNMYPVNLQEFGYIVDDRAAAAELRRAYWNPLWQWSRLAAISGDGAPRCLFTEKPKAVVTK